MDSPWTNEKRGLLGWEREREWLFLSCPVCCMADFITETEIYLKSIQWGTVPLDWFWHCGYGCVGHLGLEKGLKKEISHNTTKPFHTTWRWDTLSLSCLSRSLIPLSHDLPLYHPLSPSPYEFFCTQSKVLLKGTRMPCCIMGSGVLSVSKQWN